MHLEFIKNNLNITYICINNEIIKLINLFLEIYYYKYYIKI